MDRNPEGRSVVVADDKAAEIVSELRKELRAGLLSFVGCLTLLLKERNRGVKSSLRRNFMSEYTHTLIPDRNDLLPAPESVVRFLLALSEANALPWESSITVGLQSGQTRTGTNPITGQPISYSRRAIQRVSSISELATTIQGHSDYHIAVSGNGPPITPAIPFDFDGNYQFQVNVCLRPRLVSTSDPHDAQLSGTDVPEFDSPCGPEHSMGVYRDPRTLAMILVPGAGCSHFWIEFEFGNALVPVIDDGLEILEPRIVDIARFFFNTDFVQGCRWSA